MKSFFAIRIPLLLILSCGALTHCFDDKLNVNFSKANDFNAYSEKQPVLQLTQPNLRVHKEGFTCNEGVVAKDPNGCPPLRHCKDGLHDETKDLCLGQADCHDGYSKSPTGFCEKKYCPAGTAIDKMKSCKVITECQGLVDKEGDCIENCKPGQAKNTEGKCETYLEAKIIGGKNHIRCPNSFSLTSCLCAGPGRCELKEVTATECKAYNADIVGICARFAYEDAEVEVVVGEKSDDQSFSFCKNGFFANSCLGLSQADSIIGLKAHDTCSAFNAGKKNQSAAICINHPKVEIERVEGNQSGYRYGDLSRSFCEHPGVMLGCYCESLGKKACEKARIPKYPLNTCEALNPHGNRGVRAIAMCAKQGLNHYSLRYADLIGYAKPVEPEVEIMAVAKLKDGQIVYIEKETIEEKVSYQLNYYDVEEVLEDGTERAKESVEMNYLTSLKELQEIKLEVSELGDVFVLAQTKNQGFYIGSLTKEFKLNTQYGKSGFYRVHVPKRKMIANQIQVTREKQVFVCGYVVDNEDNPHGAVWKLNEKGKLVQSMTLEYRSVFNDCIARDSQITVVGKKINESNDFDMAMYGLSYSLKFRKVFSTDGIEVQRDVIGAKGHDEAKFVRRDQSGNYYVLGVAQSEKASDVILWKYNPMGLMERSFNNTGIRILGDEVRKHRYDYPAGIAITSNQDILVSYTTAKKDGAKGPVILQLIQKESDIQKNFGINGVMKINSNKPFIKLLRSGRKVFGIANGLFEIH